MPFTAGKPNILHIAGCVEQCAEFNGTKISMKYVKVINSSCAANLAETNYRSFENLHLLNVVKEMHHTSTVWYEFDFLTPCCGRVSWLCR